MPKAGSFALKRCLDMQNIADSAMLPWRKLNPAFGLILFGLLPAALLQNIFFAGFQPGRLGAVSIDEITSITMIALLLPWLGWLDRRVALLPAFSGRRLVWLGLGFLLFTLVHIGGMIGLRSLVHGAMGQSYIYPLAPWPCSIEMIKDGITFAILLAVLALFRRRAVRATSDMVAGTILVPAPAQPATPESAVLWVKTRQGQRRVSLAGLGRIAAAGNYVELLEEGATMPLLHRATMAEMERLLPPGFLRVHRSHIVRQDAIQGFGQTPAGERCLLLQDGTSLPLGPRFQAAVEAALNRT